MNKDKNGMAELNYLDKALIKAIEEREQKFLEARGAPEETRELLKEVLKDPIVKKEVDDFLHKSDMDLGKNLMLKKPLNSGDNPPKCLMDIVDEAWSLVENRINELRGREEGTDEIPFLKDLRNLLKLSENFRDE